MTKEGSEQGWPVIYANTPGFGGSIQRGYEIAVRSLIEQLPTLPAPSVLPQPKLVNVFGIIPQQDPFWQGHLLYLEELFEKIGVTLNPLFGLGRDISDWQRLPQAALNLVTSPWGLDAARLLHAKYGTPWVEICGIPVGAQGVGALLDLLSEKLPLDADAVKAVRAKQESFFDRSVARIVPHYYTAGFQREFAIVGESGLITSITEFLVETLGLIPKLVIITDPLPEEQRDQWGESFRGYLASFQATLAFSEDAGEIEDLLHASQPDLILGSSLERSVAETLHARFLPISFPIANRLILNRSYAGYEGGLTLIEDLGSAILGGLNL
jgi:nitrogenase molybdenum-iron protein beta chain